MGPPGGWRYRCPYCTGDPPVTSVGITFRQLVSNVQTHYNNMKHPDVALPTVIEAAICASLSPEDQVAYCDTGIRSRSAVGFGEVVTFTKWLSNWLTKGMPLVSQEEANRRAAICAGCPYNVSIHGCAVCATSIGILRNKLMQAEPTTSNSKLQACGVCGCDLKTIVHVPLNTLAHRGLDYSKVPWCWQNGETKPS
jgi:hypothetical protein